MSSCRMSALGHLPSLMTLESWLSFAVTDGSGILIVICRGWWLTNLDCHLPWLMTLESWLSFAVTDEFWLSLVVISDDGYLLWLMTIICRLKISTSRYSAICRTSLQMSSSPLVVQVCRPCVALSECHSFAHFTRIHRINRNFLNHHP